MKRLLLAGTLALSACGIDPCFDEKKPAFYNGIDTLVVQWKEVGEFTDGGVYRVDLTTKNIHGKSVHVEFVGDAPSVNANVEIGDTVYLRKKTDNDGCEEMYPHFKDWYHSSYGIQRVGKFRGS